MELIVALNPARASTTRPTDLSSHHVFPNHLSILSGRHTNAFSEGSSEILRILVPQILCQLCDRDIGVVQQTQCTSVARLIDQFIVGKICSRLVPAEGSYVNPEGICNVCHALCVCTALVFAVRQQNCFELATESEEAFKRVSGAARAERLKARHTCQDLFSNGKCRGARITGFGVVPLGESRGDDYYVNDGINHQRAQNYSAQDCC